VARFANKITHCGVGDVANTGDIEQAMSSPKENKMNRLRRRLASSEGFTLIELLVVIVIIGILLAIAIPSYLGFRKQAQDTAGEANVREAVPSAESYYASNNTYVGMNTAALKAIDSGLSPSVTPSQQTATSYCLSAPGQASVTWYFAGPGGTVTSAKPAGC
jgi:type IV pilus assembly protein PilA